jgi:Phosphodiester glycosidase
MIPRLTQLALLVVAVLSQTGLPATSQTPASDQMAASPGVWSVQRRDVQAIAGQAEKVSIQLAGPVDTRVDLVCFSSQQHRITLVSTPGPERPTLETLCPAPAIAICNGGYFGREAGAMSPSGLEICSGIRTGVFSNQGSSTCAFQVDANGPAILWEKDWIDNPGITQLVECGPALVADGKAYRSEAPEDRYLRTFIATDGATRWCIGATTSLGLSEVAAIVGMREVLGFQAKRVMNLDGGPSAFIGWRSPAGGMQSNRKHPLVRNYLLLSPVQK